MYGLRIQHIIPLLLLPLILAICFILAAHVFERTTKVASVRNTVVASPAATIDAVLQDLPSDEAPAEKCAICHDQLVRPVKTPCLHVFCSTCIRAALSNSDHCPLCQRNVFKAKDQDNEWAIVQKDRKPMILWLHVVVLSIMSGLCFGLCPLMFAQLLKVINACNYNPLRLLQKVFDVLEIAISELDPAWVWHEIQAFHYETVLAPESARAVQNIKLLCLDLERISIALAIFSIGQALDKSVCKCIMKLVQPTWILLLATTCMYLPYADANSTGSILIILFFAGIVPTATFHYCDYQGKVHIIIAAIDRIHDAVAWVEKKIRRYAPILLDMLRHV